MAAKSLKLSVGGKEIAATLESKIGKDDLYGRVDHFVEQGGQRLERGFKAAPQLRFQHASVNSLARPVPGQWLTVYRCVRSSGPDLSFS